MHEDERPPRRADRSLLIGVPSGGVVFFTGYKIAQATPRLSPWAEDVLVLGVLALVAAALLLAVYAVLFRGGIERASEVRGEPGRLVSSRFFALRPRELERPAALSGASADEQLLLWATVEPGSAEVSDLMAKTARRQVDVLATRAGIDLPTHRSA